MYCPNCGAESTFSLKFCKRCGENLSQEPGEATAVVVRPARITGAVWAISLATVAVALGGLGIVFNTVWDIVGSSMVAPGVAPEVGRRITSIAIASVIFGSATTFAVVAMLLRLLSRLITGSQGRAPGASKSKPRSEVNRSLSGGYARAKIQAPSIAVPSVTEHTTRNFQPRVYEQDADG